jgi:hypothetical protein
MAFTKEELHYWLSYINLPKLTWEDDDYDKYYEILRILSEEKPEEAHKHDNK